MRKKRLGILGGTFDPIHIGHLQMAEAICDKLELEQVLLIPAYVPPHKIGQSFAAAEDRYAMTLLAAETHPRFKVSDMELKRSGVSYTIDTVRELHEQYADWELYFIIGADSVPQLHTWNNIQELLELVIFAAAARPGYTNVMDEAVRTLGEVARERILLLPTQEYNISSTEIRQRVQSGSGLEDLVPAAVAQYICEHKLYRK